MPKLVVLGGYATAGKDAVADILVEELGWYKTFMSKSLLRGLLTVDPWIDLGRFSEFYEQVGYEQAKTHPEVRRLLQAMGTEFGREQIHPDVWVAMLAGEVRSVLDSGKNVVVTGIRYHNELDHLSGTIFSYGSDLEDVWVSRPGINPVNTHSSDNTLTAEDFRHKISNDGTLEDLKNVVLTRFQEKEV